MDEAAKRALTEFLLSMCVALIAGFWLRRRFSKEGQLFVFAWSVVVCMLFGIVCEWLGWR